MQRILSEQRNKPPGRLPYYSVSKVVENQPRCSPDNRPRSGRDLISRKWVVGLGAHWQGPWDAELSRFAAPVANTRYDVVALALALVEC